MLESAGEGPRTQAHPDNNILDSIKWEIAQTPFLSFSGSKNANDSIRPDGLSIDFNDGTSDGREGKRKDALPRPSQRNPFMPKKTRWEYDDIYFRNRFKNGNLRINMNNAISSYFSWLSLDTILIFNNSVTGEVFRALGAKRGNRAYARKKKDLVQKINRGMKNLQFDNEIGNLRSINKNCHLWLITLTFDPKKTSMEKAWYLISNMGGQLNRFKADLTKIFGTKATITVKEAQSNGYPAPHILLLVDRPMRAIRHLGKGGASWRLSERQLKDRIERNWGFGFVDVEAVVSSSRNKFKGYQTPINYVSKYLTKCMDISKYPELKDVESVESIPKELWTAVYTHVWNKILRTKDFYVSKAFKERLNLPRYQEHMKEGKEKEWSLDEIELRQGCSIVNTVIIGKSIILQRELSLFNQIRIWGVS